MCRVNIFSPKTEKLKLYIVASVEGGVGSLGDTVGALCAVDYKGAGNQYVNDGKCIIQPI